jgi:hypothetical protein
MTVHRDPERRIAEWLEAGPTEAPSWAVDAALTAARAIPQRRAIATLGRRFTMTMPMRLAAAVAVIAVVALGATRLVPLLAPAATQPSTAVSVPEGTWERTVGANTAGTLEGTWDITFESGQLFFRNPGGASFGQVVAVAGDELTLPADDCPSGSGPARYRWRVRAGTMTVTKVTDPSACRAAILEGTDWKQVAAR